ncbi:MAG TPA: beta-ketoacyl-[acyl-carrier-protein] synthase family protein [Terriglobales bacterium]|nr:beta-ketoacyl-[acyl-carrier-protein] synthase family protein [Terriglobales bacterium]
MPAEAQTRHVVITGVGLVSPLGNSPQELWAALRAGRSGVGDVPHLALDAYRTRIGGAVKDFQPRAYIKDGKSLKLMTRPVRLGVAAVELAVRDAGLDTAEKLAGLDPARIASYVGSPGHAGDRDELLPALDISYHDALDLQRFGADGIAIINPLWLLKSLANLVLYFVSLRLGAQGPNANICMSGAGGAMAIGEAYEAIRHHRADVAVAGGYESLLDEERLESFEPSGLLYLGNGDAARASRPFDRDRAGFVAAEGGAFVVLEEREHARARGARIYGEIRGYGCASSGLAGHNTESAAAYEGAMEAALADARLDAWNLGGIFAHGLSTPASDRAEAEALARLLTARAAYTPVTAVKSLTGNLLAASGPLELIAALAALGSDGFLPPILNCDHPDPDLGLDYVRGAARAGSFRNLLLNAAGLGGTTAALVVDRGAA